MEKWEKSFWMNDYNRQILAEYKKQLQVGLSNEEAEAALYSYFTENGMPPNVFFIGLALAQWNLGRLSPATKAQALSYLEQSPMEHQNLPVCEIRTKLLSQMPVQTHIRVFRGRRCPWKEGDLLAYRIQNEVATSKSNWWNQYFLLRVTKVTRQPFSAVSPDKCYHESMLVGLYNWVGDSLPTPSEIGTLEFTPIRDQHSVVLEEHFDPALLHQIAIADEDLAHRLVDFATKQCVEMQFCLLWDRACQYDGTITRICNSVDRKWMDLAAHVDMSNYSIGGVRALDALLCNRMDQLRLGKEV